MGGRVTTIGGKLYYSSDTAGAGVWGTTSYAGLGGGAATKVGGQYWFPVDPPTAAAPTAQAAEAPSIDPVLDNNVSVSVYGRVIPISAGKRRLPGDLIWLKHDQLNTEGDYTANAAYSFGYRLIPGATCNLVKVWANGIKIYDATSGFIAEGFSFVFYDGSQVAIDSEISADKGADITPAYKEQIYIRGVFPTKEFNGSLPNISVLVEDEPGGFERFAPWASIGSSDTLNQDDKSGDLDLTDGDLTAERVEPDPQVLPYDYASARGTKGRSANQPAGYGWFVFEERQDVAPAFGITQGAGLATEAYAVEGGPAGDTNSTMKNLLGATLLNGGTTSADSLVSPIGEWRMYAVRLDLMKMWYGYDLGGVAWPDGGLVGRGDPIPGTDGVDISFMSGHSIFPAVHIERLGGKISLNFSGPFVNTPPGWTGGEDILSATTLTGCIVAVGVRCGFTSEDFRFVGLDDILVTGIVIASDTDFLSFLKNSGRTYGFDYTESGGQILCRKAVIGTSYTVDIGSIPEAALIPTSNDAAVTTTRDNSHRPEIIEIAYQDETIDYQPSMQRARIPRVKSPQTDKFGIPYVMSAQEAITGAATALYREHFARVSHAFQLPFQYQRIEPTDLIEFTSSGKAYTVKVSNVVRNSDLSVRVTAVNLLTSEAEPISDTFTGSNYEDYRGGGYSGDPNIDNVPLEILFPLLDFSTAGASASVVMLEDI